jgi:hypothetical protein
LPLGLKGIDARRRARAMRSAVALADERVDTLPVLAAT